MKDKSIRCPMCGMYDTGFSYIEQPDPRDHRTVVEIHYCNNCNDKFKVLYLLKECAPAAVYRIVK